MLRSDLCVCGLSMDTGLDTWTALDTQHKPKAHRNIHKKKTRMIFEYMILRKRNFKPDGHAAYGLVGTGPPWGGGGGGGSTLLPLKKLNFSDKILKKYSACPEKHFLITPFLCIVNLSLSTGSN